ncbi:MAG: hypothetical protein J6B65_04640 [Paludibacteraceae bacterium]|nr:hypothetical protein [Paludibacteraceae bacterium]
MKNSFIISIFLLLVSVGMCAQEQRPAALGGVPEYLGYTQVYDFIEEMADMGIISVNSVVKPYDRNQIAAWLVEVAEADTLLSVRQRKELLFYLNDFALECEGMYDGIVQWSNVGSIVNRDLWGDAFSIHNSQFTIHNLQQSDPSVLRTAPLKQGSNSERAYSPPVLGGVPEGGGGNNSQLSTFNSQLYSLSLLQPAFHYADKWFECKINPILGMDLTMNRHGMVMHRWYGAEIRADIMDHLAVWGSIRDHSFDGSFLDETYFKSVGSSNRYGAQLSRPQYLNTEIGVQYKEATYGGDYSEIRAGIKAYAWWGSIGLVKDNVQWGDSYHSSNILSGRAPSFPMIELKLKPCKWFRLDYIHGWLVSNVIDSTNYFVEEQYTDSTEKVHYRPKNKFIAANMLTFTPVKGLDLSIGNSIVYSENNVQAAYFIPFAFYKSLDHLLTKGLAIENQNSQLFFNVSTRNLKYTHFYASVFVDEVKFSRFKLSNPENNPISWKVGGVLSNWPIKNLTLNAEYTRTNILNYTHSIDVLTWSSNNYNLGHYLGDNSQEIYVSLAYKPVRGLSLMLSYVNATKYNEYDYVRKYVFDIIAQKPFNEKVWRCDEVKLHAVYEVVNNAYAFVDLGWSNIRGFTPTSEAIPGEIRLDAEGYLKRYTPAFYWGQNFTVKMGFSFYY